MNVLYLAARFPWPPHRGDRLTGYHLLRALAPRHRVTLVSFVDGREPDGARRSIEELGVGVETVHLPRGRSWGQAWMGLLSSLPSQVSFYRSGAMHRRVAALVAGGRFDAVFVQLFRMAQYARTLPQGTKVLFLADSLALALGRSLPYVPWWRRPGVAWERRRVAAYEPAAARDFRESWVLSGVDRDDLARRGCTNARVVTHGVDERLFALAPQTPGAPRVTFLGNLSVPHNVDAATFIVHEIWPRVRALRPEARLELVGADPVGAVRQLGSAAGVTVVGPVPDLVDVWRGSSLLLAPLRFSSGIQNKILEAMAAGVPVVTTPQAAEAIGARHGEHLRVGEGPGALAAEVAGLLAPGREVAAMVASARELVRARFTWRALVDRLETLAGPCP